MYSAFRQSYHAGFIKDMIQGEMQWAALHQPQPQHVQHALVGFIRQLAQFTTSALDITVSPSAKFPGQGITSTYVISSFWH